MSLKDRVYVVTGSTTGIGKAVALLLAREGAKLTVHCRRADRLEEVAREVENLSGHKPAAVLGQIQDQSVRTVLIEATLERFGRIDGIVCNVAGTPRRRRRGGSENLGRWANEDIRAMQHMLDLHLLGPYDLCRRALPHIIENKGSIVMVSSLASMRAIPGMIAYCTAKAAVDGLTRALALDVARTGVRVNSVDPGKTGMEACRHDAENPETVHRTPKMHANGRLAQPEEVAESVAFLLSPRSQMITGASITVGVGLSPTTSYN